MKHSLRANNGSRGFTLTELLIASSVMALVLTAACGTYFTIAKEWERQQNEAGALIATTQACSKLSDYISQAVGATVVNRFATGDALAVNLPLDQAYGINAPIWSNGTLQYRSGTWVIFYLSDSTGSYSRAGNILWAGTMSWTNFPASVVPDSGWSLYYGGAGRISPVTTLCFTMTTVSNKSSVTTTVTSSYKIGTTTAQITKARSTCLRNSN